MLTCDGLLLLGDTHTSTSSTNLHLASRSRPDWAVDVAMATGVIHDNRREANKLRSGRSPSLQRTNISMLAVEGRWSQRAWSLARIRILAED